MGHIYTIPTCQNPTGANLPMGRRTDMLRITKKYGLLTENQIRDGIEKLAKVLHQEVGTP